MVAEQTMDNVRWFEGTADAVRKCIKHFNDPNIEYIIVLSGDQLYKMDLNDFLHFHRHSESEITVSCCPVPAAEVSGMGIMGADENNLITKFVEKPSEEKAVENMHVMRNGEKRYLGSMGIYCFNAKMLKRILTEDKSIDFGHGIIPNVLPKYKTSAYVFEGYWSDIGTIESFYRANLDLAEKVPALNLFDKAWPYFTRARFLSPSKVQNTKIDESLVSEGAIIENAIITHSIVGLRSIIRSGTEICDSILMGNDYYETEEEDKKRNLPKGVRFGVGKNCVIKKAIIDKNVLIGDNVKIINKNKRNNYEGDNYCIENGIVVIEKNAIIPAGTVI